MSKGNGRLRLEYIDAATLEDNPANWRPAGEGQMEAIGESIERVGWAGALLYNEVTGRLIDGHKRKRIAPGPVPVLIGSWTEAQELEILGTLDPITALAEVDPVALGEIMAQVNVGDGAIKSLFDRLAREAAAIPVQAPTKEESEAVADALGPPEDVEFALAQIATEPPPPVMTWVLVGIPTVRFGEIAKTVETFAKLPDVVVESTANNG